MKKKEMAALFDELGEAACKSRVMAFGKLPNGLSAESLDLAALAVASTFSFCAAVADGAADGAFEEAAEASPSAVLAGILRLAIDASASARNDGTTGERRACRGPFRGAPRMPTRAGRMPQGRLRVRAWKGNAWE